MYKARQRDGHGKENVMGNLIEQIKADREAGTPGLWDWSGGDGPSANGDKASLGIWSEYLLKRAVEDAECEYPDDEKWLAGIWGNIDGTDCANARRIARVPEMEERILSDADEITRLRAQLDAAREQVAGAYLAAASSLEDRGSDGWVEHVMAEYASVNAEAIRSLTPADATAALEARDERVRAVERMKVMMESLGW